MEAAQKTGETPQNTQPDEQEEEKQEEEIPYQSIERLGHPSIFEKYDMPFIKQSTGIDPIIEQEASFEQTQKLDLKECREAADEEDEATDQGDNQEDVAEENNQIEIIETKPAKRSASKIKPPTRVRHHSMVPDLSKISKPVNKPTNKL